jgi:hypothetical protein
LLEVIVPALPASGVACVNALPEHAAANATRHTIATSKARSHPI